MDYIRRLSGYEESIISLQKKINDDKNYRKQTAKMPGFDYSFNLWSEKSGFHNFVHNEAEHILKAQDHRKIQAAERAKKAQERQNEHEQHLEKLSKAFIASARNSDQSDVNERLNARLKAIDQMRNQPDFSFDYSSQVPCFGPIDQYKIVFDQMYGTALDCQLHKELYQTRLRMMQLEHEYAQSYHLQIIGPAVHNLAAQAKEEQRTLAAFELSDFCHALTQVVSKMIDVLVAADGAHVLNGFKQSAEKGWQRAMDFLMPTNWIHALKSLIFTTETGVMKGTKAFIDPEHWQAMITGPLQLALLFIHSLNQEDARDFALYLSASSNNPDVYFNHAQEFRVHSQAQMDALYQNAQRTYREIAAMSWEEQFEKMIEVGTTMVLDVLALNALSIFASASSRFLVTQLNSSLESGIIAAERYTAEVVGFGKVIIEEGPEVVPRISNIIKNAPDMLNQEGKTAAQVIQEMGEYPKLMNNAQAAVEKTWKATNFSTEKLQKHFRKHVLEKAEWGTNIHMTLDQYLNKARSLLNSKINNNIDGFTSKEGWVFRYNKVTNEFATAKPDGTIETLFRPKEGIDYWMAQITKYK